MKKKIAKIVQGTAVHKSLDGAVEELMRIVEHHMQEEETEMFPDVREVNVDLIEVGRRLAAIRVEVLINMRRDAAAH